MSETRPELTVQQEVDLLSRLVTPRRLRRMEEVLARRDWGLVLVCDRIRNPHNTSAMLRSAEALGLARVLVVDDRDERDPGYRLCRGVALGAQQWLQVEFMGRPSEAVQRLQQQGLTLVAADNAPEAIPVAGLRLQGPLAVVIGSELEGLHPDVRAAAAHLVRVETRGFTTSFNASCAAAILLHQLTLGRRRTPVPEEVCMRMRRDWLRRSVRQAPRILAALQRRAAAPQSEGETGGSAGGEPRGDQAHPAC